MFVSLWTVAELAAGLYVDAFKCLVVRLWAHEPLAVLAFVVIFCGFNNFLFGHLWGGADDLLAVVRAFQLEAGALAISTDIGEKLADF